MNIISVNNLSKQYRIGTRAPYKTLRETLMNALASPARLFRRNSAPLSPDSSLLKPNTLNLTPDSSQSSDTFWALKDVSFEVQQGEVIGIIGRNGAGKSTLLKILSRITEPTEGEIRIRGRVASLLEVGTGFHPELTGRENIYLNGAILGMTKAEIKRKFDEIVAFAEIEKFLDTPVKRYSSGMYVRLAFAVAAHLEPEILVVDEVLAVGDAQFQKKCLGKMGEVSKEGRTVLFVSHNMAAVSALCQRGIELNQGSISFEGNVQEAISHYASQNIALSGGVADLTERTNNRYGPKENAFIRYLKLLDCNGNPVDILYMGQPVFFQIEIDFKKSGNDFEIGIGISNMQDILIHRLVSNWEGFQVIPETGIKTIEVKMPAVHLYPGLYQVMVWEKKQAAGPADDIVREALRFSVEEAQITPYNAYFQRYSQNTQVYIPSIWRLIN